MKVTSEGREFELKRVMTVVLSALALREGNVSDVPAVPRVLKARRAPLPVEPNSPRRAACCTLDTHTESQRHSRVQDHSEHSACKTITR